MDEDRVLWNYGLVYETSDDFPNDDFTPPFIKELACGKCGGREFRVGTGMYLVMISCTKCKIPVVIMDA